jgi:hypothetical protein
MFDNEVSLSSYLNTVSDELHKALSFRICQLVSKDKEKVLSRQERPINKLVGLSIPVAGHDGPENIENGQIKEILYQKWLPILLSKQMTLQNK